jgi:protein-S-isoprenylcysteine O-methyltransferase Ste14
MADNTEEPTPAERTPDGPVSTTKARLFDVRRVIGGLFVVYGLVVTVAGLFDNPDEIRKAAGLRINLWTGLAMLTFGALFLLWQWRRPLKLGSPPRP